MFGDGFNKIFFMAPDGEVYSEPRGAPVIRCVIPREASLVDGQYRMSWEGEDWRAVWALVDTGADKNYIDVRFAEKLGLTVKGTVIVQGATSTDVLPYFEHVIFLPGANQVIVGEFASSHLADNGRHYPLIIGSETLMQGVLLMDRWNKSFRFDSLPQSAGKAGG